MEEDAGDIDVLYNYYTPLLDDELLDIHLEEDLEGPKNWSPLYPLKY